jgi:hypothetical protein
MENLSFIFNSRRKFFYKLFIFITLFFLVDQVIGLFYRKSSDVVSKYWHRRHLKIRHVLNQKYDYLIFGSSKSLYSIDPKVLNSDLGVIGFNSSVEASDIHFYIDLLEMLVKKNNLPKNIIFNIFALSLEENVLNKSNIFNILGPQDVSSSLYEKVFPFESKFRFINSLRFHKTLPDILNGFRKNKTEKKFGYRPRDGYICEVGKVCNIENEYDEYSWLKMREGLSYTFNLLDHFISLAEENNINLIFIASPIYNPTTLQLRKEFYYWGLISSYLNSKNKIFLDYRQHTSFYRKPGLFSDLIHLNLKGSEKFTELLSIDLGKYLSRD